MPGGYPSSPPEHFSQHAASENVYAGTAMARRSAYMFGAALARGTQGAVGAGLGQTVATGGITLIAPTLEITHTGQEETIDGVHMVFQMAPETEAPAEFLVYFPDHKALCAAEDATHTLHNLLTLRGALVRNPHAWAHYLTEALDLFGPDVEVVFASHHWPTWGNERVVKFISEQRDLYAYLHEQTLRMINQGYTGIEIAELLELPPVLEQAWHARGYYGSVSHDIKAIYQRYMGWFDGNPAHLWQHPPTEQGKRYVALAGGADALLDAARASFAEGDYRWVAEIVSHLVFAEPDNDAARELLADTLEQLGYGAENGIWRNFFLSGTTELREGKFGTPTVSASADVVSALTPEMLFDAIAIQIDGPRAWGEKLSIDIALTDVDARYRLWLRNGALVYSSAKQPSEADVTLTTTKRSLPVLASGQLSAERLSSAGIEVTGDASVLLTLASLLDPGDKDFSIVTP